MVIVGYCVQAIEHSEGVEALAEQIGTLLFGDRVAGLRCLRAEMGCGLDDRAVVVTGADG